MTVRNSEIAAAFYRLAELLEIGGANPFRVRAYRNAGRTLEGLPESVEKMLSEGKDLSELPGIGRDLAGKIAGMVKTGRLAALEAEEKRLPPSLVELSTIPGLGAKRIRRVYDELGISGVPALARAAAAGKLAALPGIGVKLQNKIAAELAARRSGPVRWRIDAVEETAQELVAYLEPAAEKVEAAGSLRRCRDTIGDLDIVAAASRPEALVERFVKFPDAAKVDSRGPTRSTVVLRSGLQVDLRVVAPESYGAALLYLTGSKAHNILLRAMALKRGYKLNEYGLFKGQHAVPTPDEAAIYRLLGLPFIEPELREGRDEVEAAKAGKLPALVSLDNIRGDLHVHTLSSDGQYSTAKMAEAAGKRGYDYIAVTDHSKHVAITHGLDERRLARQLREIDRLNEKGGLPRILKSAEVDILPDGRLDYPDQILRQLDIVVCAVHSHFDLGEAAQTRRIIKAMDNACFDILAHPTGRLINGRRAYAVDMERILGAAKERGCFLEINSQPERLDLDDVHARLARDMGVKLAVSTDAHGIAGLNYMHYGVGQARRAWLTADDVLNTRPWTALKRLLRRR